jgi:hypothetical protein
VEKGLEVGRDAHAKAGCTAPATLHRNSAQISMIMEMLVLLHAKCGNSRERWSIPYSWSPDNNGIEW